MEGYIVFYDLAAKKINKTVQTTGDIITRSYYCQQSKQLFFCEKGKILSVYSLRGQDLHLDHKIIEYQDQELTINDFAVNPSGNQVAYERSDSTLTIWDFKENQWKEKPPLNLSTGSFKAVYYNDSTLFSGSRKGYLQYIDSRRNLIVKSKQLFDHEIFDFVFSADHKDIAVTDQKVVKILPIDLKSSVQINSNIPLITHLQWINKHQLMIAGVNNSLEFWDFPTLYKKNLLYSENIDLEKKKATEHQTPHATGLSYLLLMEKDSVQTIERILARTNAIEINDKHRIAIAREDLQISLYDVVPNDINFVASANAYPYMAKWGEPSIHDLEFKTDTSLYFGATYSVTGLDVVKGKNFGFRIQSGGVFDQIRKQDFEDILLYKYDSDMDQRKVGKVMIEWAYTVKEKPSSLNKKIRSKPGLSFKNMLNPSGFRLSPAQKYLITYDSKGQVQLFSFDQLHFIYDGQLTAKPIRAIYFFAEDLFFVIETGGTMTKYSIKDNKMTEVEKIETNLAFEKVAYNGENIIAFYDQDKVQLFDLSNRQLLITWINRQKGYDIEIIQFLPGEQRYLVVLNEQSIVKEKLSGKGEMNGNFYLQTATQGVLTDKDLLLLGDSTGQVKIYNFKR